MKWVLNFMRNPKLGLRIIILISGEGDCGEGDCGEADCGEGEWIPIFMFSPPLSDHWSLKSQTSCSRLIQLLSSSLAHDEMNYSMYLSNGLRPEEAMNIATIYHKGFTPQRQLDLFSLNELGISNEFV